MFAIFYGFLHRWRCFGVDLSTHPAFHLEEQKNPLHKYRWRVGSSICVLTRCDFLRFLSWRLMTFWSRRGRSPWPRALILSILVFLNNSSSFCFRKGAGGRGAKYWKLLNNEWETKKKENIWKSIENHGQALQTLNKRWKNNKNQQTMKKGKIIIDNHNICIKKYKILNV